MPYIDLTRTLRIKTSKAKVYNFIRDFKNFEKIDPFSVVDTDCKINCSTPSSGVGAWQTWDGNITGVGKMTILKELENQDGLDIALDFYKPRKSIGNFSTWRFNEIIQDNVTYCDVTWGMRSKLSWYFLPMRSIIKKFMELYIGQHYNFGLAMLAHELDPTTPQIKISNSGKNELTKLYYIGIPFSKVTQTDIPKLFDSTIPKLAQFANEHNIAISGVTHDASQDKSMHTLTELTGIYTKYNPKTDESDGIIGFLLETPIADNSKIQSSLESAKMLSGKLTHTMYNTFQYIGSYKTISYLWLLAIGGTRIYQTKVEKSLPNLEIYKYHDVNKDDAHIVEAWCPINFDKFNQSK